MLLPDANKLWDPALRRVDEVVEDERSWTPWPIADTEVLTRTTKKLKEQIVEGMVEVRVRSRAMAYRIFELAHRGRTLSDALPTYPLAFVGESK